MTDIFTLRKNPYKICNIRLTLKINGQCDLEWMQQIAFRASQLWQKVSIAMTDSASLEIFKAKIKLWGCDDCRSNLCKRFIASEDIYNLYDCIF